jgi:hypothetical protein
LDVAIVQRGIDIKGFVVLPQWWAVEPTLA